jgi:hypothetical protein
MSFLFRALALAPLALVPWLACSASGDGQTFDASSGSGSTSTSSGGTECNAGEVVCEGNAARLCDGDGHLGDPQECAPGDCLAGAGCVACAVGSGTCQDGIATGCSADGTHKITFECDPLQGMECTTAGCVGVCTPAALGTSYVGCEYWPTVTRNSVWEAPFQFAVAMASTSPESTKVTVEGPGFEHTTTLLPYEAKTLNLPWVDSLKGPDADDMGSSEAPTSNAKGGAYRLRSTQPIVVYQFNPLEYENTAPPPSCPILDFFHCYSYSNDASLLLPTNALTGDYYVFGYRTVFQGDFLAITATADATQVTLNTGPRTYTLAGAGVDLGNNESVTLTMNRGEVLELFTKGTSTSQQWSGSTIKADQPVQVITGSPCAVIPNDTVACDHLEESVLPAETLGTEYVVTVPRTPSGLPGTPHGGKHTVRVHGVVDGTTITYDPPEIDDESGLEGAEVNELVGVDEDFVVRGDQPFAVTHYMHGQGDPLADDQGVGAGDPSQSIAIPTAQFRKDYTFVAPASFETSYVNVIAKVGQTVEVDGSVLSAGQFDAIGQSGWAVARVELAKTGGHRAQASEPFGIVVYAYGQYTSYMYPGGMDLKKIAPPIPE